MPFNPEKNYDLYEILCKAETGDRDAMLEAVNLMAVEGLAWDDETGDIREKYVRYLTTLAEQGCSDPDGRTEAKIMLADVYARGKFVPMDAAEAMKLYESAAEDGALAAYEFMGDLYYLGNGVPRDYEKAFACYTKTGADPEKDSHSLSTWYRLGEMYRQGLGVGKDQDKALASYGKALEGQDDGFPDDFAMPCLIRYAQLILPDVDDKDTLEEIWHNLDGIRDYYAVHPDNLEGTDITQEELEEIVKQVERKWKQQPEEGEFHEYTCEPPISPEEFHENVQDVILDLEDKKDECLVVSLEGRRKDRITTIQTYLTKDFTYHVEILRTIGRKKLAWQCLTPGCNLTLEETLDVFKKVLVDNESPDLSLWKDMTEEAKKTIS